MISGYPWRNCTSAFALLLLLCVASRTSHSQSFDCAKAATLIEKTVCGDPNLKRLDSEVAKNYRAVRKQVSPDAEKALVASQRDWIADRNSQCASGSSECLTKSYRERDDVLVALLARASEENPVIDAADPAVMRGNWTVSAESPAGQEKLVPVVAHVPPAGSKLTAKPGELCVEAPKQETNCGSFGLAIEEHLPVGKHGDVNLAAGSVMALAYWDGKADFEIVIGPNHDVAATYLACEEGAKNCRRVIQPWNPASPDATIQVYHVFTATH